MRHDLLDEFAGLLEGLVVVNQDLANVTGEVVAQGANHCVALAVDQERRFPLQHHIENRGPDREQVFEVPGELLGATVDTGRAQDDAHALGNFDVIEGLAGKVAFGADDAPRDAAGARLVRLEDDEATCQADEGRESRALVAALFLVDLDDNVLALAQDFLDVRFAARFRLLDEVLARNLFEGEEPVAFCAVVNERRFEAWLDAGYFAFVDVGFLAFACC